MEVFDFVAEHLGQPEARILEIGCGDGELAKALARDGHSVTAIDPKAPVGPIFQQIPLERFDETTTFDAIVANRSLHHVHELGPALVKIEALLEPDGVFILNEFAWDRMDDPTARWYFSHRDEAISPVPSLSPETFPEAWIAEHEDLHTSSVMKEQLEAHFATKVFEWVPYMAHYYLERTDLESQEAESIASGDINALGIRYVGTRQAG
jgi:2-polyprenyl-3-methyl-5-hydroxy-6-metoxy-1,4-benzoquinol methylase